MSDRVFSGSKLAKGAVGSIDIIARTQEFPWNQEHLLNHLDLQSYILACPRMFSVFCCFFAVGFTTQGANHRKFRLLGQWALRHPADGGPGVWARPPGAFFARHALVAGIGRRGCVPFLGGVPVFFWGCIKGKAKRTPPILRGPPILRQSQKPL